MCHNPKDWKLFVNKTWVRILYHNLGGSSHSDPNPQRLPLESKGPHIAVWLSQLFRICGNLYVGEMFCSCFFFCSYLSRPSYNTIFSLIFCDSPSNCSYDPLHVFLLKHVPSHCVMNALGLSPRHQRLCLNSQEHRLNLIHPWIPNCWDSTNPQ